MRRYQVCAALLAAALFAGPASASLVHYYSFDDLVDGGNATDSVGGATGTWNGDAGANLAVPGILGTASQTNDEDGGNGEEHYTTSALTGLNGASGMSISLWFNLDVEENNNSTYNGLFMTRNLLSSFGGGSENWGIALEDNAAPRHIDWRVDGVSGVETDDIPGESGWHHVLYTWDGDAGTRSLSFDGNLLVSESAQTGTITDGASWEIGNDTCCGNREFTGTMDDIAVYDMALHPANAANLYAKGLQGVNAREAGIVPEPTSVVLGLMGACGFAAVAMRRRLG